MDLNKVEQAVEKYNWFKKQDKLDIRDFHKMLLSEEIVALLDLTSLVLSSRAVLGEKRSTFYCADTCPEGCGEDDKSGIGSCPKESYNLAKDEDAVILAKKMSEFEKIAICEGQKTYEEGKSRLDQYKAIVQAITDHILKKDTGK